ncbi:hypothetical protein KL950_000062 [Ogataea haglerorum]|nr:hypothetical protein KL914_000062 [Ogataea haglerorum]KAG7712191.1 hypothetical protein KL950_000062 [Ogataea haglerorum]KAG7761534.1 hypothetical protein KL947_000482 [Ogataea haglerorum]
MNCKFFGALTYTVNLNFHGGELTKKENEQQLNQIRIALLNQVLQLINDDAVLQSGMFVVKKMLSNLSLMFMNSSGTWCNPLLTLINCIVCNQVSDSNIANDQIDEALSRLPSPKAYVLLLFVQILAEELVKKEATNVSNVQTHNLVHQHLFPTSQKLMTAFINLSPERKLIETWLDCLVSWVGYASKAEFDSTERYDLTGLLSICISLVTNTDYAISQKAIETLSEALETNATFFNSQLKADLLSILFGEVGLQYVNYFSSQQDEKSVADFARLIIAFLDTDLNALVLKLTNDENEYIFDFLLVLTDYPGIPIEEESVSRELADFWLRFADYCICEDTTLQTLLHDKPGGHEALSEKIRALFEKVTQIYWKKAHVPEDEEDFSQYKQEFALYRRDIGDLFESVYPLLKLPLIISLLITIEKSIQIGKPADIEPSLYLVTYISKDFGDGEVDPQLVQHLGSILDANLLPIVLQMKTDRFRYLVSTTIQFFSSADWFYKTDAAIKYLPQILSFLFDCMINTNIYQLSSSKAISNICSQCRYSLIEFLPSFETMTTEMINNIAIDPVVRQRIINAYASIIEGVKDPVIQGEHLFKLFDLLDKKSVSVFAELATANAEEREKMVDYLTSLMSSVSAVGKGMQLPDEVDGYYTKEQEMKVHEYWTTDPLGIHSKLLTIITNFTMTNEVLSENYQIIEEAANLFKCGLTESLPGPFVFDCATILQFIVTKFSSLKKSHAYPLLYSLLNSVVTAHYRTLDLEVLHGTVNTIFLSNLPVIEDDPDLVQSSLNLFSTMLTTRPSLLLSNENLLMTVLEFAFRHLGSNERFVLKALEKFWTRFITLRKGDRQDTVMVKRLFNETKLGYVLTFNVLKYMFATQRSNLETFIEIIKQLVAKYPLMMNKWLQAAFPKLNEEREKKIENWEIFVKKVMLTRGTRSANDLIKDFWLEVNGLINYK